MTLSADQSTTPLLELDRVEARYGRALAVAEVSLRVDPGSIHAVVGPNGAGKSTLARAISGLIAIKAGTINLDGEPINGWPPDRIRRAGIVHLPEGRGVFRGLTVDENLRMATSLLAREERLAALGRAYEIFPALRDRRRQAAGTLSGGEQQMLSLARGLAVPSRLIIADEMSLGLAPAMVDIVFEGLVRARATGVAVLLIEQFVHRALAIADHCTVLVRGAAVWAGAAVDARDEVLRRYLGAGEM
jgi:branched-chain amino acid transport system ATP-binding protein